MAQRSPKQESPSRQSFFLIFFVKSISVDPSNGHVESEAPLQIKMSISKGSQVLSNTRNPFTLGFENNWMKVQKIELPFMHRDSNSSFDANLTLKLNKVEKNHEQLISEISINPDKYIQAYLNEGTYRTDQWAFFGKYKLHYIIFTDRSRHNLQKIVRTYRDSQQFEEWSSLKQQQLQRDERIVKQESVPISQKQGPTREVASQALNEDKNNLIQTPEKCQKEESPAQLQQQKKMENAEEVQVILDKSAKNDQNEVSEVIEVSEAYNVSQSANQDQILPQEKESNQVNDQQLQAKLGTESIGFSAIRERPSDLEEQTPEQNLEGGRKQEQNVVNSSFMKKQVSYYDRTPDYYEPPKQQEQQSPAVHHSTHHPTPHLSSAHQKQNNVNETNLGTAQSPTHVLEEIAQKTDSILQVDKSNTTQQPVPKESQVIETVGGEHGTTEAKSSDWKLTLKILLFFILIGIGVIYFMTPRRENKLEGPKTTEKPKKKQGGHQSGAKKSK